MGHGAERVGAEAETGPTAAAWHSTKFLDPVTGGAVLPVPHLNGYKISSPTLFATMSDDELADLFRGYGWDPRTVDRTQDPHSERMTGAVRDAHTAVTAIQRRARAGDVPERPAWPMIVLRSLKSQGAPAVVGGKRDHVAGVNVRNRARSAWVLVNVQSQNRTSRPDLGDATRDRPVVGGSRERDPA